jgi:hypothetical protein
MELKILEDRSYAPAEKGSRVPLWIFLRVVVFAGLFLNPVGCAFVGAFIGMGQIRLTEAKLRKPQLYQPVARILAIYCQSDQTLFPRYLSYAWLPAGLGRLGHPYCSLATNYAHVEMGGGFYHYGYRLQLDEAASTAAANVWKLSLYREGSKTTLLTTLVVAPTQRLEAAELVTLASAGYDESIKRGNTDAYRGKVLLQLRYGNSAEAAQACQAWIKRRPGSWLPRFTYAHVRCRQNDSQTPSSEFEDWVQYNNNFAHSIYLALFQFREGRTNEALKAIRWAVAQPFVEPLGTDGNKFYLGQNGALMAYIAGDHGLSLKLCDKMLASPDQDQWWTRKILKLKAANLFMQNDRPQALATIQQAALQIDRSAFDSESRATRDRALLVAIERRFGPRAGLSKLCG